VDLVYFLTVSPGWFETMRMRMMAGREFLSSHVFPGGGGERDVCEAVLSGGEPGGTVFRKIERRWRAGEMQGPSVVADGVVADAPYRSVREPELPVAFVPLREVDAKGVVQPEHNTTSLVRLAGSDLMARARESRKAVAAANGGMRASNVRTQQELVHAQTVRERLLAMLGVFFAAVALLLAGIGLYGVLNYSVLQRRREIAIRVAVGARGASIARLVTGDVFSMVAVGVVAGVGLGLATVHSRESLSLRLPASGPRYIATRRTILSFPTAAQCGQQREHQFSVGWLLMWSTTMTFDGTLAL
jgi:putative ABC transport system permease protein